MDIILFPGQGSQSKGMGKDLFEDYKDLTDLASEILEYDLRELCLEDPGGKLILTQFTQPALYVVNALAWFRKKDGEGAKPYCALGHSLGEYNALLAAGAFDFETGLKLVKKRGELMGAASGGTMAAVMNISPERIRELLDENHLESVDLANYNTPSQIVVSGPVDAIEKAVPIFSENGGKAVRLKVGAPFHSRYMESASVEFAAFLKNFTLKDPDFMVIANKTARPYEPGRAAEMLSGQIASPVLWTDSIRYLMGFDNDLQFTEINAKILTPMTAKIRKSCTPIVVEKPHETDGGRKPAKPFECITSNEEALNKKSGAEERIIKPEDLGNPHFCRRYGLKYPYVAGAMYQGISSKELVTAMGKAGMIGYLGTGGLTMDRIEKDIQWIQKELSDGRPYGVNLLHNMIKPKVEEDTVDLYLKYGIRFVEAAAYLQMTPALVRYRLAGLKRGENGSIACEHHVIGKCSRPEIAEQFMSPAPERIVRQLLEKGAITAEQAEMAKEVPMAHEICVEADSGGHTDMGIPTVLLPAMLSIRKRLMEKFNYAEPIFMGLAGGIGAPQSALAAFVMGADFILTGSINQCTVEAGNSDLVKDMLQLINIQDTDYAPAGDMFEMGAKVQVLRRSVFFPARANMLYQIYTQYDAIDEIPEKIRTRIQDKYFKRSFNDIWEERKAYLAGQGRHIDIEKAEKNPKQKMASIFRWYFHYSSKIALEGNKEDTVNFQVQTGPALGAFNQWVMGTGLENWRNRHVDKIAVMLLEGAAELLRGQVEKFCFRP